MKTILRAMPIILMILLAPFCIAAGELQPVGQSLGFVPTLDFAKEGDEGRSYYSATYDIRLTILETEKNQQNRNLQALEEVMKQIVPHTSLTIEQNMNGQVNAHLMKFTDIADGQEMYRWVYLMEGATKFGQIYLLGPAESFQRVESELLTMLRSFRWLDDTARATYSMIFPVGWKLAANTDLVQVFTPDGVPYDKAPTCITVVREEHVFTAEEKNGYHEILMKQYPGAILQKSFNLTIDSHDAFMMYLAVQRADGMEMVFLNCVIYTPSCTFVVMGVRNAGLTEELFETVVKTFMYSGLPTKS